MKSDGAHQVSKRKFLCKPPVTDTGVTNCIGMDTACQALMPLVGTVDDSGEQRR